MFMVWVWRYVKDLDQILWIYEKKDPIILKYTHERSILVVDFFKFQQKPIIDSEKKNFILIIIL